MTTADDRPQAAKRRPTLRVVRVWYETAELFQTNEDEINLYRRWPGGEWEYASGLSWEKLGETAEIEALYQQYKELRWMNEIEVCREP